MATLSMAEVKLEVISQIESSNNPKAFNKKTRAYGLFQITPICLKHYNSSNNTHYSEQDLFNPTINRSIADWYIKWIASKCDSDEEILIAYNWGYGNLRKWNGSFQSLPKETQNYVTKYHILENKANGLSNH